MDGFEIYKTGMTDALKQEVNIPADPEAVKHYRRGWRTGQEAARDFFLPVREDKGESTPHF